MIRKHMMALAVAGTLVAAGTGAALAASTGFGGSGSSTSARPQPGFDPRGFPGPRGFGFGPGFGLVRPGFAGGAWQAAADYLGVSVSTLLGDVRSGQSLADVANGTSGKSRSGLIEALVAHQKSQLDEAVKAGKLTQAQADKVTADLEQRITKLVDAKRPAALAPGKRGFGIAGGAWQAAADYLGVSVSTLLRDVRSGQSLADVANGTSGKSRSGLIDALVAQQKSQLDEAVKAGKLTQAQADKVTADLEQRITKLVDAKWPATPFGRGRGFGFGFGFGGGRHGGRDAPPAGHHTNA